MTAELKTFQQAALELRPYSPLYATFYERLVEAFERRLPSPILAASQRLGANKASLADMHLLADYLEIRGLFSRL